MNKITVQSCSILSHSIINSCAVILHLINLHTLGSVTRNWISWTDSSFLWYLKQQASSAAFSLNQHRVRDIRPDEAWTAPHILYIFIWKRWQAV